MPVLPIDTGRYGTPKMLKVFEEKTRVQKLLDAVVDFLPSPLDLPPVHGEDIKTKEILMF